MSTAILGRKIGMMRLFDSTGNAVSCTVVQAGPCVVLQKMNATKHGYSAVQIGFEEARPNRINKPKAGQFVRLNMKPMKVLREIRMPADKVDALKVGDTLTVGMFQDGELVDVIGTSKGRGFAGVVKRYHFAGHPQTRGTHFYRRHPGSIGHRECPGKVWKGKKLPGHMGDERVTTQNLRLFKVDAEKNLLLIRGSVPGYNGALVMIRKAKKAGKA